jgi:hypothetical protein
MAGIERHLLHRLSHAGELAVISSRQRASALCAGSNRIQGAHDARQELGGTFCTNSLTPGAGSHLFSSARLGSLRW